jgi:hypothetical protein
LEGLGIGADEGLKPFFSLRLPPKIGNELGFVWEIVVGVELDKDVKVSRPKP